MKDMLSRVAEMRRDEIIAEVLCANTPERCGKAEISVVAWIKEHPKDFGVLDAGEQLAMMSERYDITAEESAKLPSVSR